MTRNEAFNILGLNPDATPGDAKIAWRNLVKITHPDKDSSHDAAERFRKVNTAYQTIVETQEQARQEQHKREQQAQQQHEEQHAQEEQARQEREEQRLDFRDYLVLALIIALLIGLLVGGGWLSSSNNSIVSAIGCILFFIPIVVGLFVWKPGCGLSLLLILLLINLPISGGIFVILLFTLIAIALFLNWDFISDNLPIERNNSRNE